MNPRTLLSFCVITLISVPTTAQDAPSKSHRVILRQVDDGFAQEKRTLDRTYHDFLKNLNDGYKSKVAKLQEQALAALETARDEHARSVNLEGANEIQNAIAKYQELKIELPTKASHDDRGVKLVSTASETAKLVEQLQRENQQLKLQLARKSKGQSNNRIALPTDVVRFNGHTYKVFGKGLPFSGALRFCNSIGGSLVIIDNRQEYDFICRLANQSPMNCEQYWINATDQMKEGEWQTDQGMPLPFLSWGEGEPSSTRNQEHYGSISRESGWKFNDSQGVYRSYGFICEWDY